MTPSPSVLLVAPTPRIAAAVTASLLHAGADVTVVTSFKAARKGLESYPTLLISEVRLGEYNGLHLALRARSQGIRAIMVGDDDQVTRREAEKLGADYVSDCDATQMDASVRAAGIRPRSRYPRRIHAA
jgi:DNA-binding response OmpR family regulator